MKWLGSVLKYIHSSGRPEAHRNLLMIRAVDLSEICDNFVPFAPPPAVIDGTEFRVGWEWTSRERDLSVLINSESIWVLRLVDGGRRELIERPTIDDLKTAVRSFFEGWEPQT